MAYHVYHTEALLLGGVARGEGDRLLYCYTRDLGLVLVHAKSLREMRSRLRYALQTFSHAHLDLIHGKHGWKLISARPVESFSTLWCSGRKRTILAQYTELIRRLIQGEQAEDSLFHEVLEGMHHLRNIEGEEELRSAELLFVVRLLHRLGYWGETQGMEELFTAGVWNDQVANSIVRDRRTELLSNVNRALRETQL